MMLDSAGDQSRLTIVTPVYNDWESLQQLLVVLDQEAARLKLDVSIVVVDDGSTETCPHTAIAGLGLVHVHAVDLVELTCNLGHQRALAVGLSEASRRKGASVVITMDADGEDRPSDIGLLLARHWERPNRIIAAGRGKRSEGLTFRFFYKIYQTVFRLLTGKFINFGNFLLIPAPLLKRIVFLGDIWNNLPAALAKSRLPLDVIPTERGKRYRGVSKMNFTALVIHGMCAISVFIDVLLTRMLLASISVAALAVLGMGIVIGMRVFTALAIPGWATSAFGILGIIVAQMVLLAMVSVLSFLNNRSVHPIIPIAVADGFISRRLSLFSRHSAAGTEAP